MTPFQNDLEERKEEVEDPSTVDPRIDYEPTDHDPQSSPAEGPNQGGG
jgi:hypothetical protein